jgi:hypothetical protein
MQQDLSSLSLALLCIERIPNYKSEIQNEQPIKIDISEKQKISLSNQQGRSNL